MAHFQSLKSSGPRPAPRTDRLVVALGARLYRVERPWGDVPSSGKVTDVAALSDGRVVALLRHDPLVDSPRDSAFLLSREGRLLGGFGQGRIGDAHMVAVDSRDRIFIVDRDSHEIVAFDSDGRELLAIGERHAPGAPFNHPSDVAIGPDGVIAVADGYAGGHVRLFAPDGAPLASWGRVGVAPGAFMTAHGIAWTADGRIVVADRENHRLQVFDRSGALLAVWMGFWRPSSIWRDAGGDLVVSDGVPTLSLLSPDGDLLGRCRPALNGAHGLCGDRDGAIYLAEGTPSRLTRLSPEP
jgi:peptidylglycine monooxygenase